MKQKAATAEKDIWSVAKTATKTAFQTGNFDALKQQYGDKAIPFASPTGGGTYNFTPTQLETLYNQVKRQNTSLGQFDIPSELVPSLPANTM